MNKTQLPNWITGSQSRSVSRRELQEEIMEFLLTTSMGGMMAEYDDD